MPDQQRAGDPPRWTPAIAVAGVVFFFLAGLPLIELALTPDEAPPIIQVPVGEAP